MLHVPAFSSGLWRPGHSAVLPVEMGERNLTGLVMKKAVMKGTDWTTGGCCPEIFKFKLVPEEN